MRKERGHPDQNNARRRARYAERRAERAANPPEDDEPVTAEDLAAIAASRAAYERGDYVTDDKLDALLPLQRD
jgi:hypothetical protein